MSALSPEYEQMRDDLAGWFEDGHGYDDPVYAKLPGAVTVGRDTAYAWEVRAGFIGASFVSCRGLALVVRRGLRECEGVYRVDVYEPRIERVLPAPTEWAGRLKYAPRVAGFAYSHNPDTSSLQPASIAQFRAMNTSLGEGILQPAPRGEIANWVRQYEQIDPAMLVD